MPYTINHSDKDRSIPINDREIDNTSTSLTFVGKNYPSYARPIAENFLHLLENFASSAPPDNPTVGQLWYDTDDTSAIVKPQLKVWDNTNWVSATNVFKGVSKPVGARIGDIWIDIAKQQLYIYSGLSGGQFAQSGTGGEEASWLLIGPQFSAGSSTGPVADKIYDITNKPHNIIKFVIGIIEDETVSPPLVRTEVAAIVSFTTFTPKATIPGFSTINVGLNLSSSKVSKVWGTAHQAENLVSGNEVISAANVLRKDASSTTNYKLNVAHGDGIAVGASLATGISNVDAVTTVIYNKQDNSRLVVKLNQTNDEVLSVSSTELLVKSGAIRATASAEISGAVLVTNSTESESVLTGSLVTAGGVGISGKLNVGKDVNIGGTTTAKTILPGAGNFDIGSSSAKWNAIYTKNLSTDNLTVNGSIIGTVTGNVIGSASSLTSPTNFSFDGDFEDIEPASTIGNGSPVVFKITATTRLFENRGTLDSDSSLYDQILVNRPGVGLKRLTKAKFISNIPLVPVGTVLRFAGPIENIPQGYIECNFATLDAAAYPALYNAIGNIHDTSVASGQFRVPPRSPDTPDNMIEIIFTGII